jgi:hypothetical protein
VSGTRIIQTLGIACAAALLGLSGWVAIRTWPRPMHLVTESLPPVRFEHGKMIVALPTKALLAEVGRFDDELSAYLWFDYLRSRPGVEGSQVLLTVLEKEQVPVYRIEVVLPNDALSAIPFLADLEAKGFIEGFDLVFTTPAQVEYRRVQTSVFVAAYRKPVAKKLETLPRKHLLSSTAHFLAFKSRTDPRDAVVQEPTGGPVVPHTCGTQEPFTKSGTEPRVGTEQFSGEGCSNENAPRL